MVYTVKLYKLDDYNKSKKFIKESFINYKFDDALKKLKNDEGFHMRIERQKTYIFYGDCDGFQGDFNEFAILLKEFLDKYYDIKIKKKDISYTVNNYKKNEGGFFHYSIPSLHGIASEILSEIHVNFQQTYEKMNYIDKKGNPKNCIDKSVYRNQWFRMPNQTKEGIAGTEHIIMRGKIEDFILDYIPENSLNIDNKIYKNKTVSTHNKINKTVSAHTEKNKFIIDDDYFSEDEYNNEDVQNKIIVNNFVDNSDEDDQINIEIKKIHFEDIKEIITNLNKQRADVYDDWISIGMGIKFVSSDENYFNLWDVWSQNSIKYKEGECKNKWKSFAKKNNTVTHRTLLYMLKNDNKDKFISICKKLNIKNIIMERKHHFPDNDLQIDNIISNCNSHYIQLADKYCPIVKGEHNKRCNYMEIDKLGQLVLKCFCVDCRGKEFPQNSILMLSKDELKTIFNLTQNNYITINNNIVEVDNSDKIYSEKIKIDSNAKIFEDDELNKLMLESLSASDAKIAKVLLYLTKNIVAYHENVGEKTKIWYEFKNHRWIESPYIQKYISDDFVVYYQKIILHIKKSNDLTDKEKNTSVKEIQKIINMLECRNRKKNIIDELAYRFTLDYPDFYDELDTKPYIIGFKNGIYDLAEMKFRNGEVKDMVSMCCNYDFKFEYSEHKEDLLAFLKDILPAEDDREYFLTYLSSCLIGLNICEVFTILTGKGRNGKSKLIELIALTVGDYMGRPKCKLLTGTRPDENSPESGLLALNKKRIIMVSEPEVNDRLNSSFLKFITGGDTMMLRQCHKNKMIPFKANFLTFLVCNDIPNIDNMDNAFVRRLRCINFPTEFIANPTLPHQKKIDENLQTKLSLWKNDFMLLLLEYYNKFKKGNLVPSKNVLDWTNMYKEEVDLYFNFLNECTEDSNDNISNVQLYESFQYWFKKNYGNEKIPSNRTFVSGIRKHKNIEKNVWVDGKSTSGIKNLSLIE
jgi:P4 family phage/plasmid primase-like protien